MKIIDYTTVKATMGDTKTVQDFGKWIGNKPHKLGLVASMYEDLAATYLTDSLLNIYYNERSANQFQPVDSTVVEWFLDQNFIEKIYIATDVTGTTPGLNKLEFDITFTRKYYDKYDTFTLENRQQLFVVQTPTRLATNLWRYTVRLVGNDLTKSADKNFMKKGNYTRLRSNYHPELSEMGYSKFQSNTEMHRNHLSLHRASATFSQQYAVLEDVYLATAEKGEAVYLKMNKKEKECTDSFMYARNQHILFGKSNFDINGKCLDQDAQGRDIPMGDGIVHQLERYCDKMVYSRLSVNVFDEMLDTMVSKAAKATGNKFVFIVNEKLWSRINRVLRDFLKGYAQDGTYFFSKAKNGEVKVGATFSSYEIGGNVISFTVDRCLSHEYDSFEYGIMVDVTPDTSTGRPGIAMFSLKGSDMLSGNLKGMGGLSGTESGDVATPVAGSSYHLMGYSGVAVFNPYRSFILQQSVIA